MDEDQIRKIFIESAVKSAKVEDTEPFDDFVYRLTGLTLKEIRELKERDTAKAPEKVSNSNVRYTDDYICPNCGKHFTGTGIAGFCYHCGQRIKWED